MCGPAHTLTHSTRHQLAPHPPSAAAVALAPPAPLHPGPDRPPRRPVPDPPLRTPHQRAAGPAAAPPRHHPSPPRSATGHRIRDAPAALSVSAPCPPSPRSGAAPPHPEQDLSEGTRRTSTTLIVFVGVAVLPAQR
ncbi:predicted GPI-anchored protein 58 [Miscanthus floridulus]|uniref:predicted GPI-anchored protein 58 n=1 Tax=Miscanthus floridulus TaxID=154761 RepID=UPI0034580017